MNAPRVVDVSALALPSNHLDEGLRALLNSILFVRHKEECKVEWRFADAESGLNLSYAAMVDGVVDSEIDYVIKKLHVKGLPGIIRLRFLEIQAADRQLLSELFTEEPQGTKNASSSIGVEVWNIPVDVIDESATQSSSENAIRAALLEVYDASLCCDHFSGPCVFTLSVVRKARAGSGSDSDAASEGGTGQRKRRSRPRSTSVSSANGRSLLFKILNSAGIL